MSRCYDLCVCVCVCVLASVNVTFCHGVCASVINNVTFLHCVCVTVNKNVTFIHSRSLSLSLIGYGRIYVGPCVRGCDTCLSVCGCFGIILIIDIDLEDKW